MPLHLACRNNYNGIILMLFMLFNLLFISPNSLFLFVYAYEVWVDSKKIEAVEVVYRGFLKFLLRVRKTTSTSIMLT
jgi:hypothetical protein